MPRFVLLGLVGIILISSYYSCDIFALFFSEAFLRTYIYSYIYTYYVCIYVHIYKYK